MQSEQMGPYKIGRLLGRGGMGAVFAGENVETGEAAAIKVLSAAMGREGGFRERFRSEIESLKKLHHPNIVRLFGHGEQDEHLFYAMELVEGRSLEDELREGRVFPWIEVVDIALQTCRALKHAHDRGVIHRDIKPANLMITPDGTVKLSDFGIAKLFGASSLTADGGVIGTAEYMAPEQADGRPVTARCDLYSLGGVMYTLLARRAPFKAANLLEMLQLQRYADPDPLRRHAPNTPAELEAIVMELLVKDPEERIANALVLSRRLQAMRDELLSREAKAPAPSDTSMPSVVLSGGNIDETVAASKAFDLSGEEEKGYRIAGVSDVAESSQSGFNLAATDMLTPTRPASAAPVPEKKSASSTVESTAVRQNKFVKVDEKELASQEELKEGPAEWISPQTWVILASLVLVAGGIWWFMRPASADRLYARIVAADENDTLTSAENDVEAFLRHHAMDPRHLEVMKYQEEIEIRRLEKRFELRARRGESLGTLSPVERAYFEAMSHARVNPTEGIAKLEALLSLYSGDEAPDKDSRQCLELAQRQLERLTAARDAWSAKSSELIAMRMERADELIEEDPRRARGILNGIIVLYGGEPWAAKSVQTAREALAKLDANGKLDAAEKRDTTASTETTEGKDR